MLKRRKIEGFQTEDVMIERVKNLADRDLYAAMILQGLVIRDGVGNMAKMVETAVALSETLIAELQKATDEGPPQPPLPDNDEG
jgi:hypothetical protein